MKKITRIQSQLSEEIIPIDQQKNIKGGGWGDGRRSNGNGCPPPSLLEKMSWGDHSILS